MTEEAKLIAVETFGPDMGQRILNAAMLFGPTAMDDALEMAATWKAQAEAELSQRIAERDSLKARLFEMQNAAIDLAQKLELASKDNERLRAALEDIAGNRLPGSDAEHVAGQALSVK